MKIDRLSGWPATAEASKIWPVGGALATTTWRVMLCDAPSASKTVSVTSNVPLSAKVKMAGLAELVVPSGNVHVTARNWSSGSVDWLVKRTAADSTTPAA